MPQLHNHSWLKPLSTEVHTTLTKKIIQRLRLREQLPSSVEALAPAKCRSRAKQPHCNMQTSYLALPGTCFFPMKAIKHDETMLATLPYFPSSIFNVEKCISRFVILMIMIDHDGSF